MTDTFCGIKVSGDRERPCGVAFLSDAVETFSTTDDEEMLRLIEERQPEIVAFSAPINRSEPGGDFREGEEDLIEEGKRFRPPSMHDTQAVERTLFLKKHVTNMEFQADVIECRPMVTADVLEIRGDPELEDFGIDTDNIHSTTEFEAVLAAVTAKLYAEDHFRDKGFIVPEEV